MEEWKEYRLGDLFERVTRKNTNLESKNVLTISAQHGLINQEEFFNKSVAGKNLKNYYLLKKGEFAYNKSYSAGYPMGATKMLEKYDEGVVSTLYICFKSKSNLVHNEYFKYYFESKKYYEKLAQIVQEGARNHGLLNVGTDDFFNIKIKIPNIKEQEKIANILYQIDCIKNNIKTKVSQLEKAKSYYMDMIYEADSNLKTIEDIANIYIGLTYTPTYVKEGIPFLSCKNLKEGKIDWNDYNLISTDEYLKVTDNAKPKKGDILFGRVGSLGKPVVLNETMEICIFVSVGFIRVKDEQKYINEYIAQWMNSKSFNKLIAQKISGSSQKNLNTGWLKKFQINIPDADTQIKWSKFFRIYDNYIEKLNNKYNNYEQLKHGLLQKLLKV